MSDIPAGAVAAMIDEMADSIQDTLDTGVVISPSTIDELNDIQQYLRSRARYLQEIAQGGD